MHIIQELWADELPTRSPSHLLYAASPLLSAPDLASQGIESCHEIGVPVSRRLLPTKVLLIHGGADLLSPFSPAILFRNLLIGVGLESDDVKVKLYRHLTGFGALSGTCERKFILELSR